MAMVSKSNVNIQVLMSGASVFNRALASHVAGLVQPIMKESEPFMVTLIS